MARTSFKSLPRALTVLAGALIVKVTVEVVTGYRDYFPPDFHAEFLHGRESFFWDGYHWPFYAHIVSGPPSLLLGLVLLSERLRQCYPSWHRRLGRVQAANVLFVVTPSGLWMAGAAAAGPIAGLGFACLAVFTGITMALGWRAAVKRRFAEHRRWMWRCFVLLCSAVVLRLAGGFAVVSGIQADWFDPVAAWACWVVPLASYELLQFRRPRYGPSVVSHATVNPAPVLRR